jgi:hypothetical protein
MDEATQRDLAALADGSLEPEARAALLRRAEESQELAEALARQRTIVTAIRATRSERAPDDLRARIAAMAAGRAPARDLRTPGDIAPAERDDWRAGGLSPAEGDGRTPGGLSPAERDDWTADGLSAAAGRDLAASARNGWTADRDLAAKSRPDGVAGGAGAARDGRAAPHDDARGFRGDRRRLFALFARRNRTSRPVFGRPRVFALGSAVAAVAAAAVIVFAGGAGAPSVADAAQLALAPARGPAPEELPGGRSLDASVDGVAYPYWEETTGWRAVGSRSDAVDGRSVHTVFYVNKSGARIGYSIAAGSPLAGKGGTTIEQAGVGYRVIRSGGATIVTWLRDGHTCVLAARDVDASTLLHLATWS